MRNNPSPFDRRLGRAMRFWRGINRESQRAVSTRMAASRCYYSRVETGASLPTLPNLLRICRALDVSPYMLLLTMEAFDDVL